MWVKRALSERNIKFFGDQEAEPNQVGVDIHLYPVIKQQFTVEWRRSARSRIRFRWRQLPTSLMWSSVSYAYNYF